MKRQFLLCWLFLFGLISPATATHIVGGEMVYNYLGNDRYEIKMQFYIDCYNGSAGAILLDTTASIVVFNNDTVVSQHYVYRSKPIRLNEVNYTCISPSGNVCVDMYVYDTILTLPPIKGGYDVAYQRCCRNHSILNIIDPGGTGATYQTHIPGKEENIINNSPRFKKLPPNYLCINEVFEFDHGATDPDGDSLVYRICTPFSGATGTDPLPKFPSKPPFAPVVWNSPYNDSLPLPVKDSLFLDSLTGKLKFTPNRQGQYVFGVCVEEYRDGVKIGQTLRDYQFNIMPCVFGITADFDAPDPNCSTEVKLTNQSIGADSFSWTFQDKWITLGTSHDKNPTFLFPDTGTFSVLLESFSGNCYDSVRKDVRVLTNNYVLTKSSQVACKGVPIVFTARRLTGASYQWHVSENYDVLNANTIQFIPDDEGKYAVSIRLANCRFIDSFEVSLVKPTANFDANDVYCNLDIELQNMSTDAPWLEWVVNSGVLLDTSNANKPKMTFSDTGKHTIALIVRNGGCSDTLFKDLRVLRNDSPLQNGKVTVCVGDSVFFKASFIKGATYTWNFHKDFIESSRLERQALASTSSLNRVTIEKDECIFTDSFELTVFNPKVDFSVYAEQECAGSLLSFTNNSTGADSFKWVLNDQPYSLDKLPNDTFWATGGVLNFRLEAHQKPCFNTDTFSLRLSAQPKSTYFIPNVITLLEDGMNDCFTLYPDNEIFCSKYEMFIYNRWGELMYEEASESIPPCWKGDNYRTGKKVFTGTYFYLVRIDGRDNFKGTVTVLR